MQEKNNNHGFRIKRLHLLLSLSILVIFLGAIIMNSSDTSAETVAKSKRLERIQSSPNFKNNHFVNAKPAVEPPLMETMVKWLKGANHTTPDKALPVVKLGKQDFSEFPTSGLRVTWMGHSSALIELDGKKFLTDPIWSDRSSPVSFTGPKRFFDPPLALNDLPPIDAVIISHDHYDHLDKHTVQHLATTGTRFIVPLGVGAHLESWQISEQQITELDWWESTSVGNHQITATPARHFSGRSMIMADRNKTLWCGFTVSGPDHNLYYTGDTAMFDGFKEIGKRLGPFDAVLVEVGAYNKLWADLHLGPEQAVQAVKEARGKLLIPVHWATFNLALHSWVEPAERLILAAKEQNIPLAIPKPGENVEPSKPKPLVRWWPELPWQTKKEHPVISSGLENNLVTAESPD